MDKAELLNRLGRLRQAQVGGLRAPHKPLLLLWLFGRFAATGSTSVSYKEAEEPLSHLINQFGPPVRPSSVLERVAMPFIHLERELWDLRDATGASIGTDVPRRRRLLLDRGAVGRLHKPVETLLADPMTLADAARLLLDRHFTPTLATLICDTAGLDLPAIQDVAVEVSGVRLRGQVRRVGRVRRPEFSEAVLRAYAFACAVCGYDGALGRTPVGIEAAHVRWHSQGGPDDVANGLALCALHHKLLDLGILGLTTNNHDSQGHHVKVSALYVARSDAGRAVYALDGRQLASPRPGQPEIDPDHIAWHDRQVFRTP